MRKFLKGIGLLSAICVLVIGFGHPLVNILDKFFLSQPQDFRIEDGNMWVTDYNTLIIHEFPQLDSIQIYSDSLITISVKGKKFPLGFPQQDTEDSLVFFLLPEQGDKIQIRYQHSYFSWLTPFEMNFMTGASPSHKRNCYYTLTWIKADSRRLAARWRYQQSKYRNHDWNGWRSRSAEEDQNPLTDITISELKK